MAKKKAEKSTENAGKEYPGTKNLVPVRTKEEAKERGRNGGLKSAEVRRKKRTMRDMAKGIMETTVSEQMSNVRETLARMGLEENDMTYQAAVVVRLIQKAMVEGDTSAIRVLGELTGELNRFGYVETDDPDVIEMQYPTILIPENGRDAPKENVLGPQAGPQTMFMASSADIVIYGGAAGGGKTYALLLEEDKAKAEAEAKAAAEKKAKLDSLKDASDEDVAALAQELGINPAECKDLADVRKKVKAALSK